MDEGDELSCRSVQFDFGFIFKQKIRSAIVFIL